jgi:hypothetical protein
MELHLIISLLFSEFYLDFAWYHEDFYEPEDMFGPHWADITLTTKDSVELHCYLIKNAEEQEVKVCFSDPSSPSYLLITKSTIRLDLDM